MNQKAAPLKPLIENDDQALELQAFERAIGKESDPTMLILRAHLFSESLLERLIPLKLARGDRIIDNGSFTFAQKLVLVEAIDCLEDSITSSLRNLNKLRNQCAHELGRTITASDVTRIGSPLGKYFTQLQRESNYDPIVTLRGVIDYVCGYVTGACHAIEEARAVEREPKMATASSSQGAIKPNKMQTPTKKEADI